MYDDVVQLALAKVWSTPDSSNQYILRPGRITPDGGVRNTYRVKWDQFSLPDTTGTWHLYQIGNLNHSQLRLFGTEAVKTWIPFSSAINASRTLVNVYTTLGIELPRFETYYYQNTDGNLLVAVRKNPKLDYDFDADMIYVRIYQNAYFSSEDAISGATLTTGGSVIQSTANITAYQAALAAIRTANGYTGGLYCTINGFRASDINTTTAAIGDYVEYIYDQSIYRVVDFQVKNLPSFHSDLDEAKKYLLHYATGWSGHIDFAANVDLYMIDSATQRGVYMHKNQADAFRSVTYKDYGVRADYLADYFVKFYDEHGNFTYDNIYVRMLVRHDGIAQSPPEDANRQYYLLRLSDADQTRAMVGLDANVTVWNAASLEQSAYAQLMSASLSQVTQDMSERALGYSVINYELSENIQKTALQGDTLYAPVSRNFQLHGGTVYEYDSNGLLLGFYPLATNLTQYHPVNSTATLVEYIEGTADTVLDELYGAASRPNVADVGLRFYTRKIVDGQTQTFWSDVTGDTTQVRLQSGLWKWQSGGNKYRISRADTKFLGYTVALTSTDGVLQHSLTYIGMNAVATPLPVPLGQLDVWINKKPAVEGVDYIYAFPLITIISKELLVTPRSEQILDIRMTGFCKSDLTSTKIEDIGFTWDGVISVDGKYDPDYMKSTRTIIGGKLYAPEDVSYAENTSEAAYVNGLPYAVREYVNHLNGFISREPYEFYAAATAVDDEITAYLTLKLGNASGPINPIPDRYQVYSPFLCKVIYALLNGNIAASAITGSYSDAFVTQQVQSYLYLINSDPIKQSNLPDLRYCVIMPHWNDSYISLTTDQYRFYANVVRIYAEGLVDLSSTVNIVA